MFSRKSITKLPIPSFATIMSLDSFQNLLNEFFFNLIRHSTLYDLPFQSYDQCKTSKNVTVRHSDPSVTWTHREETSNSRLASE